MGDSPEKVSEANRDAYVMRLKMERAYNWLKNIKCPNCGGTERSYGGDCTQCGGDIQLLAIDSLLDQVEKQ